MIWVKREVGIFFDGGLDNPNQIDLLEEISLFEHAPGMRSRLFGDRPSAAPSFSKPMVALIHERNAARPSSRLPSSSACIASQSNAWRNLTSRWARARTVSRKLLVRGMINSLPARPPPCDTPRCGVRHGYRGDLGKLRSGK